MSLTKEQRDSLRAEGSLFFGSSPPYVEVRNADHTVCVKLSDMLDHMDAAEAENDALRHAFDDVNWRIGALDMTVPANKSLYEALLTALDKVRMSRRRSG